MDFTNAGKRLRKKRNELDMKQSQLAERTNLSIDYISKLERGERVPKLPVFINIINELGISADEVLGDSLNKGYVTRTCAYIERIGMLNKDEQERVFNILEACLNK